MKNPIAREKIKGLIFISVILMGLFILALLKLYECPVEMIFGVPCPVCGITRALASLLRGDIGAAFFYHPLWPTVPIVAILYILYCFDIITPSKRQIDAGCVILAALVLGCYIIRHITGSPVVAVHFSDSLLGRLYEIIR